MIQSIKLGRQEDGNRSIADKIIKRLNELEQTVGLNQGRWIWELLQNAKDSIIDFPNRKVSVEIILDKTHIEFKHNGACFTERDIRGLINQISSKEVFENKENKRTGKFGTGFLTTHLLSKVVRVKGVLIIESQELFRFECKIDREAENTLQLLPKIQHTWEEFDKSLTEISPTCAELERTSFIYNLKTDQQKETSLAGVEEFLKLVPLVLIFNQEIKEIILIDRVQSKNIHFSREENKQEHIYIISRVANGEKQTLPILSFFGENVSIAAQLREMGGKYFVEENSNHPKLFCNFPLIGTEKFYLPVIVNSFYFNPRTERDGIWLKENNDKVAENKKLLEAAISLFHDSVAYVSEENIFELYNLADTRMPKLDEASLDKGMVQKCYSAKA
ncbi:hypothetical protein IQ273_17100 [Nodosilinea sp. LEGE 07298]|uniref:sacsin N-terminal ATP-binding-like domain-containing protein n=1 Tax=Nodosilinea sp. LEGE 07298 TaxID=2777970 RepID=UPI00187F9B67|nr:hypothetical protein [Nodosilinea sp. LEGE 07298]MBE9111125.1 hypothetical protein [Nodosilinea sp. LEGE 07298]